MNKEKKFRVWDGNKITNTIRLDFAHGLRLISVDDLGFDMIGDDKCILMQYIGLKDRNGKEIYEGDIVKVWDTNRYCDCENSEDNDDFICDCRYICIQEVKWSIYGGYFCDEDTGDFCPPLGSFEIAMEVIGNIYENKELLK